MMEGTVHVVDDDAAVLSSMRWLLESVPFAVETYASAGEFLKRYDGEGPACLVLDLVMPEMTGLELQEALGERGWTLPVIFLTAHATVPTAVTALRNGAIDFLEKPCDDHALIQLVTTALGDDRRRRETARTAETRSRRLAGLTRREHQVVTRVAAGLPNKLIAVELGISPRTVEVYRAQGMRKTGARSLAELVQLVLENGKSAAS
jgi:FixJ family two-component response regulator